MVSVNTSTSVVQDMSVVEVEPQKAVREQPTDTELDTAVQDLSQAFSSQRLNVVDIDAEDKDNPQLVSEYVNDIYPYMRALEVSQLNLYDIYP